MNGFKLKRLLTKMLIQLKSVMPGSSNISLVKQCVYLKSVCGTNKQKNSSMFAFSHYYKMVFITSDFAIIVCDVKHFLASAYASQNIIK